jgi:micrococcal nuclease
MINNIFKSILLLLIILTFYPHNLFAQPVESIVKHVINGNTIELDTGEKVQYIGVVVPDPAKSDERLGKESLEFNKNLVEGKKVRLEYDDKVKDKEHFLAYVYQENVFVNAEIIKQGYGSVFIVSPNIKYALEFIKLEGEARQAKRGVWSEQKVNTTQTDNPTNQDISSLEKRISILEAKITELNSKLDQLLELVKTLQAQPVKNTSSIQNAQSEKTNIQSKTDEAKSDIVYVSKAGTKYHKLNCRFLVGEPKQITIEEAKRRELEPCKICFPETRKKVNDKQK